MVVVYSPPLQIPGTPGDIREITLSWDDMDSRYPKDIYMSCMAMCILALTGSIILMFVIFFGITCKTTARLLNLMTCGLLKWIIVLFGFLVFLCVVLSWTIFMMFNIGKQTRKRKRKRKRKKEKEKEKKRKRKRKKKRKRKRKRMKKISTVDTNANTHPTVGA